MDGEEDFRMEEELFEGGGENDSLRNWVPEFDPSGFGAANGDFPEEEFEVEEAGGPELLTPKTRLFAVEGGGQSTADSASSATELGSRGGCRCKKSQCMRLHCQCLLNQRYCSPACRCVDCINTPANDEVRRFVVEKTKLIFPQAFQSKVKLTEDSQRVNVVGCKCKMGCQKKYCECFKMGVSCSPICRCESCQNSFIDLNKKEISEIFLPHRRKKHKLMLQESAEFDSKEFAVVFQPYVRPK
mgnify:CR=1 FL=1